MIKMIEKLFCDMPCLPLEINAPPVNMSFIAVLESMETIALVANPAATGIKHCLLLHKKDGTISFISDLSGYHSLKKSYFCLFMGFMMFKESHYLIFVDKVKHHKFGRYDVYEIASICVYSLKNFSYHIEISNILTEYYKLGFLFCYHMDLTDSGNYIAAFDFGKDPFRHRKNFLYFANRNLISTCISSQNKEWAIPVIYGHIYKERGKLDHNMYNLVYFLSKASMLDVNPRYKEDHDLLEDFYCPTTFNVIDTFVIDESEVRSFGLIFNDFPGVTRKTKTKSKGDFISEQINAKKVVKYFEFMRYFHHCEAFVFNGKKSKIDLMKSVKNYKQTDQELKKIIKIFVAIYSEDSKELLEACRIIIDKLSSVNLLTSIDEGSFGRPYFSFCTDRPIDQMEECFLTIYQKYIDLEQQRKRTISKRYHRLYIDECVITHKEITPEAVYYKNTVQNLFKLIKHSFFKLRNSIDTNMKLKLSQVLKHIYGAKNSISKGYIKILGKNHLPVFKTQNITIGMLTHNCGGIAPNKQVMSELYYHKIIKIQDTDLLIISIQEIVEMKSKNLGLIIKNDNDGFLTPWVEMFKRFFPNFDVVTHISMLGLLLIIFIKKSVSHVYDISIHELELIRLGKLNLANKGGIFLRFKINYEQFGIFNCHLTSGTKSKYFEKRQDNLLALATFLNSQPNLSISLIMGDTNFRTQSDCKETAEVITNALKQKTAEEMFNCFKKLLNSDELIEFMKITNGTSLEGFNEVPITFLPSYKWLIGKNNYDYKDYKRAPSW